MQSPFQVAVVYFFADVTFNTFLTSFQKLSWQYNQECRERFIHSYDRTGNTVCIYLLLQKQIAKRLWYRRFPVNLAKFLRTPFLQNTSRRLLLLLFVFIHFCIPQEAEVFVCRCSLKQMFLKISQISQESTRAGVSFYNFIKKRLQHRCFPVKFVKF